MPVLSAFELAVSLFYIRRLLFLFPCFTFAQATSTESAIAELRQLLADQRSALDRQVQIIEVQERRLAAVERRDAGLPDGDCSRGGRSSGYCAAAANKNYSCGARPGSSNHGCLGRRLSGSIRIRVTESSVKLGGQARMVAVHTLRSWTLSSRYWPERAPTKMASAPLQVRFRLGGRSGFRAQP
jgi:hypothetical protein